jgi:hypothetical protein
MAVTRNMAVVRGKQDAETIVATLQKMYGTVEEHTEPDMVFEANTNTLKVNRPVGFETKKEDTQLFSEEEIFSMVRQNRMARGKAGKE